MSVRAISRAQFPHLFESGGFSVDVNTGNSPRSGFMVAHEGTEKSYGDSSITPDHLEEYATTHSSKLTQRGMYFGGWHDQEHGRVDLDSSQNLPSGGAVNEAGAKVAMIRHGQRSMYHVDTGNVVSNPYYGRSTHEAHADIKRRYEETR